VASIGCQQGYHAVGGSASANPGWQSYAASCDHAAQWQPAMPPFTACAANPCPALSAPAFGSVDNTAGVTGDTRTYACGGSFTLVGSTTTTCTKL
jgi:hypothetical protein